ncbi:hypothetical protein J6350_11305 [Burkholderia pseudomallei]|uniref:hypothetical protein n=1 Tax=Burkholderia pseudomallei TaxID=28450 RepID=UPI001A9DA42E|nr:hypothetical protein [Burkholderia pseudomallei]MBO3033518.1 hypothetical protein [Burkholderia pseudomallei]MBO3050741.1 hypothetical protein [Burkholderia pseudomallei]MBO7789556.1 hypothetical protein [Burkholderia pseudomallei]MBO7845712.1 hypothetical protein [Burkholderia pseudomallei]QTB37230.1 hypothetical protein J3B45_02140 [Burkholderia pseudomallei]
MPALEIMLDGVTIVTVSTGELNMLTARVSGALIDEAIASLNVSGGYYSQSGPSTYLTWIADTPLQAVQQIRILFHRHGQSSCPGKTIDELYPDEPSVAQTDFTPTAEMFQQLRAMPKVREKFVLDLKSSSGASFHGETAAGEDSFALSILWDSTHPERARVSLHSNSLDNLEVKGPLNYLFKENMTYGGFVELRIA